MLTERKLANYSELVRYFGDDDPTTRVMIEGILAAKEDTPTTCTTSWSRTRAGRCCLKTAGGSVL